MGGVSPNSREGQLESISISIPLFLFCISNVWGGGGGVMLFPTFIEKNLGIQNNYFSFNVFVFFFVCWKYCKVPLHFLEKQFFLISLFYAIFNIKKNEVFGDIMVLASPRPRPPVDPDDVNTLTRKIFNGSLSKFI